MFSKISKVKNEEVKIDCKDITESEVENYTEITNIESDSEPIDFGFNQEISPKMTPKGCQRVSDNYDSDNS